MKLSLLSGSILATLALTMIGCENAADKPADTKVEVPTAAPGPAASPGPIDPAPTPSLPATTKPEEKKDEPKPEEKKDEPKLEAPK